MHLQYICNISAKYEMNLPKALEGVDFTKYALLPISKYVQWSVIGSVKNAVNLSKKIVSANKFFMHNFKYVCKISAKYYKATLKALGEVDFTKYA